MKNKEFFYLVAVLLNCIFATSIQTQDFGPLVRLAWQNNDQLKSKNFQLESAGHLLKEARSLYGPTVSFGTQYTLAAGGRSIQFPVGDLLNPVYATLNQITASNAFPQIDNVNEQFLPDNFYDARFRISQPVYYPDLAINRQLKQEAIVLKQLELKAFKRQISKEVMHAYFQVESSKKAIDIFRAADTLLREASRTTQSLIRNGVALPSALSRIETQMASITAQQIDAASNHQNALRYYTYIVGSNETFATIDLSDLPATEEVFGHQREEIDQINQGIKMQNLAVQKENQFYLPKVGLQLDLGSQAFDFGFEPYAILGVNAEINLFDSKRHKFRKAAAKADIMAAESQKENVSEQIALQSAVARQNLISAIDQAKTFQPRIAATDKIYKEVFQKYKEGTANYLELLDAQTQVTQLKIQYVLSRQNAWMKWADYMYATAAFPIE